MGTALILSETVFYFTVSLVVITIGVLCAILTYHLIHIARELEGLSRNLNHAGNVAGERINDIVDRLSDLPILSYFLKKRMTTHGGQPASPRRPSRLSPQFGEAGSEASPAGKVRGKLSKKQVKIA